VGGWGGGMCVCVCACVCVCVCVCVCACVHIELLCKQAAYFVNAACMMCIQMRRQAVTKSTCV